MGEVPLLKELYAHHKDKGVVVVGISLDEVLKPLLPRHRGVVG